MGGAEGWNLNIYRKITQLIIPDRHEMQLIVSGSPYAEIEQLSPLHSLSGMLANGKFYDCALTRFHQFQRPTWIGFWEGIQSGLTLITNDAAGQPYGSAVESIHELRMVIDCFLTN